MFKYTRASILLILDDVKKYSKIFKYGSLVFTTAYFIYALVMQTGNFIANIILATLFVGYTVFEFITAKMDIKTAKRVVKRSYNWIKLGIKTFTLGAMIYGIYTATTNVSAISTILATLMIILWVLQVLLELVIEIVEDKIDLVVAGWNKDMEDMKKPVTAVGNVIKKVKGESIDPAPEKSKEVLLLEKKIKEIELKKKGKK